MVNQHRPAGVRHVDPADGDGDDLGPEASMTLAVRSLYLPATNTDWKVRPATVKASSSVTGVRRAAADEMNDFDDRRPPVHLGVTGFETIPNSAPLRPSSRPMARASPRRSSGLGSSFLAID